MVEALEGRHPAVELGKISSWFTKYCGLSSPLEEKPPVKVKEYTRIYNINSISDSLFLIQNQSEFELEVLNRMFSGKNKSLTLVKRAPFELTRLHQKAITKRLV